MSASPFLALSLSLSFSASLPFSHYLLSYWVHVSHDDKENDDRKKYRVSENFILLANNTPETKCVYTKFLISDLNLDDTMQRGIIGRICWLLYICQVFIAVDHLE